MILDFIKIIVGHNKGLHIHQFIFTFNWDRIRRNNLSSFHIYC